MGRGQLMSEVVVYQDIVRPTGDNEDELIRSSLKRLHKPQSPEDAFRLQVLEALTFEADPGAWYSEIPVCLGHYKSLDFATRACLAVSRYRRGFRDTTVETIHLSLTNALSSLQCLLNDRLALGYDDLLVSVSLLSVREAIWHTHNLPFPNHLDGMRAVLSSWPRGVKLSDMAKRIVSHQGVDLSVSACATGTALPAELLDFRNLHTTWPISTGSDSQVLKATADGLFVHISMLLTAIRKIGGSSCMDSEALPQALFMCNEPLQITAKCAENSILHNVRVVPRHNSADNFLPSCVLLYNSDSDFEAAISYWTARLWLLRICARLQRILPCKTDAWLLPSMAETEAEIEHNSHQIIMSHIYSRQLKSRTKLREFAHAIVTVYGVLADSLHEQWRKSFDSSKLQSWLLGNLNAALALQEPLSMRDLNEAAEMLVGGPLKGRYRGFFTSIHPD